MARESRKWDDRFIAYMNGIIQHKNYKGLAIDKKEDGSYRWLAPKDSTTGQARIKWAEEKAVELGYEIKPGVYANVMLEIHPTKWKICQTCGSRMSLYYHYPNANFLKALNKKFNADYTMVDHISDIWDDLLSKGHSHNDIASFLIAKSGITASTSETKDAIIEKVEIACRKGGKGMLGPGAMSNFPDRFDGFHSYNRCCRSAQDKGRSKENLSSYSKDRRAYEYWSDGNIHAADEFMGSAFFKANGLSADHIGPISLGFIHDPRYLQPMLSNDNSSKRDRLLLEDVEKIIETEKRTRVYPITWHSKLIWEYIKENYADNTEKVPTIYRDALKQNMANFMGILRIILDECPKKGEAFLVETYLKPHSDCFNYSYEFNELGEIISKTPRHFTDRNANEFDRYQRIAIQSVYDYVDKDNRNNRPNFAREEQIMTKYLCDKINSDVAYPEIKEYFESLVETIQLRLISHFE